MGSLLERQMRPFKPANPAPPGVIPGRPDADYQGAEIVIANAVLIPLMLCFLAARVYTRLRLTRSLGLDDYYLFIGTILALGQSSITLIHLRHGLGRHMWDIDITTFAPKYLQVQFASIFFYMLAVCFVKLSVLQLYLRIGTSKIYRVAVWTLIAFTIVYHFASVVAHFSTCTPVSKSWLPKTKGHCFNKKLLAVTRAGINVLNDFLILLVPLPLLRKLQLPLKQKVALAGVFFTGTFVCIVTIIRFTHYIDFLKSTDQSWDATDNYTWCIVEVNVGIICACMATLRPLVRVIAPKLLFGSTGAGNSGLKVSRPAGSSAGGSRAPGHLSSSKDKSHHQFSALESRGSDGAQRLAGEAGGVDSEHGSSIELRSHNNSTAKAWA